MNGVAGSLEILSIFQRFPAAIGQETSKQASVIFRVGRYSGLVSCTNRGHVLQAGNAKLAKTNEAYALIAWAIDRYISYPTRLIVQDEGIMSIAVVQGATGG